MSKKVVYVISKVQKSLAFEWIASALKHRYRLTFILLNSSGSSLETFLSNQGVEVKRMHYTGKKDFFLVWIKLFFSFLVKRPSIVHAHLLDAQLAALSAAWCTGISQRIYTRHNSTFHHVYSPKGVKYDKLSNVLSTKIISISPATDETLLKLESVPPRKIVKIPHGINLHLFSNVPEPDVQAVRVKWNLTGYPIVGVVARHIEWKGVQYILPAFKQFLKMYPEACLVLANASGPYSKHLEDIWRRIPPANIRIVSFEENVPALYRCFHMYIHTPVDRYSEAFGQTYVEALAAGVPSIFTLSGIAPEFIVHNKNAWVVDYRSAEQIYNALKGLWENQVMRQQFTLNGLDSVKMFDVSFMINKLEQLYDV